MSHIDLQNFKAYKIAKKKVIFYSKMLYICYNYHIYQQMNKRILLVSFIYIISFNIFGQFKTPNVVNHWQTVVNANSVWKYFLGTTEPDSNWRKVNYNDTNWSSGKGGFGYGDGDDSTVISSNINSIYIRKTFTLADTSLIWDALLNIDYDDGFVAYINDVEIARVNLGTPGDHPRFDTLARSSHEANMYQGKQPDYIFINKDLLKKCLIQGVNVLCIQVHNTSNSNDLSAIAWLHMGINNSSYMLPSPPAWFNAPLTTHLPIFVINTAGQGIPNTPKLFCKLGVIDNGKNQNHLTDVYNNYSGNIGIETRGSSSSGFPQQSYGFTTLDSAGNNNNVKLLDFPKEHDFILYAPYTDKSLMRNNLMYEISRQMGWYASRCRFVELVLNGNYQGIYVLMENIKTDKNRVDVATMTNTMNTGDSITGGYVMKVDRVKQNGLGYWQSAITVFNAQSKNYNIQTVEPDIPDLTQAQRNYIKPYMDNFESMMLGNNYNSNTIGYKKYIDVNSFIDFYICNELSKNVDAYRLSCFFYKQRESLGGRLYMGPIWDFNIALGNANYCNGGDTTGWNTCGYDAIPFWFERLMQDNDYKKQFVCRWQNFRKNILKQQTIYDYIDSVAEYLEIPQKRHYKQWPILGQYVWPNYYIGNTYKDEVNFLKQYTRGRLNWIDKNLPKVTPACKSNILTVSITEIMYNCNPKTNSGNWIELYNNSAIGLNISNYVLRDESGFRSFAFPNNTILPAKGYLVVVEDSNAFKQMYPQVKNYIGQTNWGLYNNTGTISLRDQNNLLITTLTYSDQKPWPQLADGFGNSLELISFGLNPALASSWQDGCFLGTPGWLGACSQKLLINEINYAGLKNADAGDWVEIYNTSSSAVNLSGWRFRDNNDSNLYNFPMNTTINAGEFLVICNDTVKFKNIYPNVQNYIGSFKFGLSSSNDAVRLYLPNDTLYSQVYYTDTLPFPVGAKGTGYTIELKDSLKNIAVAASWILSCPDGTPGRKRDITCIKPQIPNLNITELNLSPDLYNNDGQWIEIYNKDSLDLDLSNWKIYTNAGLLYVFPKNIYIKSKDYLIVSEDINKFNTWHTNISKLIGNFNHTINTQSDSIILKDSTNKSYINLGIAYKNYIHSNNTGRTLEFIDTFKNINNMNAWHSGCISGSAFDTYKPCIEPNYISEISYNNAAGDWLELYNPLNTNLDMNQWRIRHFTDSNSTLLNLSNQLSSHAKILLVNNASSFKKVHPFIKNYNTLTKNLDTLDGIKIYDNNNKLIYSLIYNTDSNWTKQANLGYTLELVTDTLLPNTASNWKNYCLNGSPLRNKDAACFPSQQSKLYITEINYKSDSIFNAGSWFEILNHDTVDIDITGWGFTTNTGVLFSFDSTTKLKAHTRYIFVENISKFNNVYLNVNISGEYKKPLLFISDTIRLLDYANTKACEASYNSSFPWPRVANGLGRTLEQTNLKPSAVLASDWTMGCVNGSPLKAYNTCNDLLYISEIHYQGSSIHNAGQWFEIYNKYKFDIDLSNYKIRHAISGEIYTIPKGTQLIKDSFIVFANDSNAFNTVHQHYPIQAKYYTFNLSKKGDAIQVYNAKNQLIQSEIWESDTPWNTMANGKGYTLELLKDTGVLCTPAFWGNSCLYGTPGASRFYTCDNVGLPLINEKTNDTYIYPNPANDFITIEQTNIKSDIYIYDNLGKLIYIHKKSDSQRISTKHWSDGIYFWRSDTDYGKIAIFK